MLAPAPDCSAGHSVVGAGSRTEEPHNLEPEQRHVLETRGDTAASLMLMPPMLTALRTEPCPQPPSWATVQWWTRGVL